MPPGPAPKPEKDKKECKGKEKKNKKHKDKKHKDEKKAKSSKRCRTDTPEREHSRGRSRQRAEPPAQRSRGRQASPPPWAQAALNVAAAGPNIEQLFDTHAELAYKVASVTAESLSKFTDAAGLTASLEQFAQERISSGEPWVAGSAWGVAFMLNHHCPAKTKDDDLWERFQSTSGNMLHALANYPAQLAQFFAKYPQAVQCIAHWGDSRDVQPLLIISVLAKALSTTGDVITAKSLAQALDNPPTLPMLVSAIRQLAGCKHSDADRSGRLKQVAIGLTDTVSATAFAGLCKIINKCHLCHSYSWFAPPLPQSVFCAGLFPAEAFHYPSQADWFVVVVATIQTSASAGQE